MLENATIFLFERNYFSSICYVIVLVHCIKELSEDGNKKTLACSVDDVSNNMLFLQGITGLHFVSLFIAFSVVNFGEDFPC